MLRPCILRIRRLGPLDPRRQISLLVRELLPEVLRDLRPRRHPHVFLGSNVLHDALQRHEATWLADAAAVQSDGHHLWRTFFAFFVERVEGVLDVVVEVGWGAEAGWDVEFLVKEAVSILFVACIFLKGFENSLS